MEMRPLGPLWPVSALAIGGGGLGQGWGVTDREEAVETLEKAIDGGINLIDVAPSYGDGEAERAVGEAFAGRLPEGVRITSKCRVIDAAPDVVARRIRERLALSLDRLKLGRVDLYFLHSNIAPDGDPMLANPAARGRVVSWSVYADAVRPALEALVAKGRIGAWGITGIGHPDAVMRALAEAPRPAAVQCITNLLDSPGGLKFFRGPARPREIIRCAWENEVGVLGVRAVQAGALTDAIDRPLADDHPEMADFRRAAPIRRIAAENGISTAFLAHSYALSMPGVASVVLGVKNHLELDECLAAAEAGPMPADMIARIDKAVARIG